MRLSCAAAAYLFIAMRSGLDVWGIDFRFTCAAAAQLGLRECIGLLNHADVRPD